MNSQKYTEILEEGLIPINKPESIFQRNNAAIHVRAFYNKWFANKAIPKLTWPARSPDLNLVENVWAQNARYVYSNCTIYYSWDQINLDYI